MPDQQGRVSVIWQKKIQSWMLRCSKHGYIGNTPDEQFARTVRGLHGCPINESRNFTGREKQE